MLHQVKRKERSVEKLVEHLDEVLRKADWDKAKAWSMLTAGELAMVDAELNRAQSFKPADIRYYLENYHAIEDKDSDLHTLYPFWEPQETLWEDFCECYKLGIAVFWIFLKSRQVGWSTLLEAIGFSRFAFHPRVNGLIVAHEKKPAGKIFDMARAALRYLPWWMQPEVQYEQEADYLRFDRKKKQDRERNPGLRSNLYVDAANTPTGAGRGFALQFVHLTEIQLYRDVKIITRDIMPAVAKENERTVFGMEGTGRGVNTFFQEIWKKAEDGNDDDFPLRPDFAPFWMFKSYSKPFKSKKQKEAFILDKEERSIYERAKREGCRVRPGCIVRREVDDEQFKWLRVQRSLIEAAEASQTDDGGGVYEEYPAFPDQAWQMDGLPAFKPSWLRRITASHVRDPIWWGDIKLETDSSGEFAPKLLHGPMEGPRPKENKEAKERRRALNRRHMLDSPLWIWRMPPKDGTLYVAADPGHGIPGKDRSAVQAFWDPPDPHAPHEQIMEYVDWAAPHPLAERAAAMGWLCRGAEICPERNLDGLTEHLLYTFRYPSVYRPVARTKASPGLSMLFGWQTTNKTRNALISDFRDTMRQEMLILHSSRLLDECRSFVDDGTGPPGKPHFTAVGQGSRDDLLIAAMLCSYNLSTGEGLKKEPEERRRPVAYRCLGCGAEHESDSRQIPGMCPHCSRRAGFVPREDYYNTDSSPLWDDPRQGEGADFSEL